MQIVFNIDDGLIKTVRSSLGRVVALATMLVGVGAAYAVVKGPTHVFVAGTTISASEVNENFKEVHDAADLLASQTSALQKRLETLENTVGGVERLSECTVHYETCNTGVNEECVIQCPVGKHPISGGCDASVGATIAEDRPGARTPPFPESGARVGEYGI